MPQMAPISWLTLFVIFNITLILFNIVNYYCFIPKAPSTEKSELPSAIISSMIWLW
uniref:ATP synthase complex subunit 8 n=1 Tax=Thaumalea sp. ZK-2019 TaxID=2527954 RepID=A0A411NHK3_9DIPT|nr:ATP synthase F0 subunit 8 [Thaumalea sp. ZK-2019]